MKSIDRHQQDWLEVSVNMDIFDPFTAGTSSMPLLPFISSRAGVQFYFGFIISLLDLYLLLLVRWRTLLERKRPYASHFKYPL